MVSGVLRRVTAVGLALASGACAGGGVDRARLPDSPIALLHRTEEQALDRLDALGDLEKRQTPAPKEGVIRFENLDGMFGGSPDLERRLAPHAGDLVLLDPRTGETEPLENAPGGAQPLAWSPDRSRLLLVGRLRDGLQLFSWQRDTAAVDLVTSGPRSHASGCFASDGSVVAGELSSREVGRLVRISASGGTAALTEGPRDIRPACSPREPLVAFVRIGADARPQIFVAPLDAPGEARMVAAGLHPVFTPDGRWIVYTGRTTKGGRLFRVRPDGSGRTPLGAGLTEEGQPAVSPDGAYVAYVATDLERRERIWVRRFDGSGDRPLLNAGDGGMPVW
jgi:Tol biopolymer transport system component